MTLSRHARGVLPSRYDADQHLTVRRRPSPPDFVVPPRWQRQRKGAPASAGRRPSTRAVPRRTT